MSDRFIKMLDKKLKVGLESEKSQTDVELEGKKKKSADGAHKPYGGPVDFVQLEPTPEFDDRTHEQSDQARQDLETDLPEGTIKR